MTRPKVLGLDLSLSSTGIARVLPEGSAWAVCVECVKGTPTGVVDHQRIERIRLEVHVHTSTGTPDLVVIEDASYGSPDPGHQLAGLRWIVRHDLGRRGIPYALISPSTLKLYATGSGRATKDEMVAAAVNAWPRCFMPRDKKGRIKDDAADALWLSAAGLWHLGQPAAAHTPEALNVVKWPDAPERAA